jgi:hypothetical protein
MQSFTPAAAAAPPGSPGPPGPTQLNLAGGWAARTRGVAEPYFHDETVEAVFERTKRTPGLFIARGDALPAGYTIAREDMYYCRYCFAIGNYPWNPKGNTNIDHMESWASIKRNVDRTFAYGAHSATVEDQRMRQWVYNNLDNLEVTCAQHNRIKSDAVDLAPRIAQMLAPVAPQFEFGGYLENPWQGIQGGLQNQ